MRSYFPIFLIPIGIIFFYLYADNQNFFSVDGTGYYLRALGTIENKLYDVYWPVSFFYSIILNYIFPVGVSPNSILFVNYFYLVLGFLISARLLKKLGYNPNVFIALICLCSPFTFKYMYYAGKETFLFLILSISCYSFYKMFNTNNFFKRFNYFFIFFASIIIGTWTRPYFSSHILVALLFLFWENKYLRFLAFLNILISILVIFYYVNDYIAYLNYLFYNSFGFFVSPNPFKPINWSVHGPLEIIVCSIFFLLIILHSTFHSITKFIILLFIYGAPLALVIYWMNKSGQIDAHGVFFSRTRFPVYVFLIVTIGSIICNKVYRLKI